MIVNGTIFHSNTHVYSTYSYNNTPLIPSTKQASPTSFQSQRNITSLKLAIERELRQSLKDHFEQATEKIKTKYNQPTDPEQLLLGEVLPTKVHNTKLSQLNLEIRASSLNAQDLATIYTEILKQESPLPPPFQILDFFRVSANIPSNKAKPCYVHIGPTPLGKAIGKATRNYFLHGPKTKTRKNLEYALEDLPPYIQLAYKLTMKTSFSITIGKNDTPAIIEHNMQNIQNVVRSWMEYMNQKHFPGPDYDLSQLIDLTVTQKTYDHSDRRIKVNLSRTPFTAKNSHPSRMTPSEWISDPFWTDLKTLEVKNAFDLLEVTSHCGSIQFGKKTVFPETIPGPGYIEILRYYNRGLTEQSKTPEVSGALVQASTMDTSLKTAQQIEASLRKVQTKAQVEAVLDQHKNTVKSIVPASNLEIWTQRPWHGLTVYPTQAVREIGLKRSFFTRLGEVFSTPAKELQELLRLRVGALYPCRGQLMSKLTLHGTVKGKVEKAMRKFFHQKHPDALFIPNEGAFPPFTPVRVCNLPSTEQALLKQQGLSHRSILQETVEEWIRNNVQLGPNQLFITRPLRPGSDTKFQIGLILQEFDCDPHNTDEVYRHQRRLIDDWREGNYNLDNAAEPRHYIGNIAEIRMEMLLTSKFGMKILSDRTLDPYEQPSHGIDIIAEYFGENGEKYILCLEIKSITNAPSLSPDQVQGKLKETKTGRQGSEKYIKARIPEHLQQHFKDAKAIVSAVAITDFSRKNSWALWRLDRDGNITGEITKPTQAHQE